MSPTIRADAQQRKCQHVYIVQFADGLIKIGRTANPTKRFDQLRRDNKQHIVRRWLRQDDWALSSEWMLLHYGARDLELAKGREYFRGDYDQFIRVAEESFVARERLLLQGAANRG